MNYRKGMRALGLSFIAALGLMAFMATGAQAQWLYLLSDHKTAHTIPNGQEVEVKHHTPHGILLVPALNLEILCTTLAGSPKLGAGATVEGKLKFSNCTTYTISPLAEQKNCKPAEPIEAGGLGLLVLHTSATTGTKNYVLFSPHAGKAFSTVVLPELCALAETSEVTGNLLAECGHLEVLGDGKKHFVLLDCLNHQKVQLVKEANTVKLGDVLKFGENPATIDGIAAAELTGALAGLLWGGHHQEP